MATLVLGAVGRVFAGPLGGIAGTVLGGFVDRGLAGGPAVREVGRIADLGVQSAAYGMAIPIVVGRMRIAGNLIWTSGIAESTTRSGGGKRGGTPTDTYSYAASFAVALTGRRIVGIERVWADGRLIRDAGGAFLSPVTMRVHDGSEDQTVDPLIAAAEGVGGAPAYRGIAYAVFEDMPLGDYGNRIPNLTFEIVADAGVVGAGDAIAALAVVAGRPAAGVAGAFPALGGYCAASAGSVAEAIAPLFALAGAGLGKEAGLTVLGAGGAGVISVVDDADSGAGSPGSDRVPERRERLGDETRIACVEIGFHDLGRDYQPGLQRARRARDGVTQSIAVAAAMLPGEAKTLATMLLGRADAGLLRTMLRLPWRYLGLRAGDRIVISGDPMVWRVREVRFENFVVTLDLVRVEAAGAAVGVAGDGGRPFDFGDVAPGPTTLTALDLPPLPGDPLEGPRLWIAAAGASPGWRRAAIEISRDEGASYAGVGVVGGGGVIGAAVTVLGANGAAGWDRFNSVEVELLGEAMWLEGRSEASVLAGSNLALVGDEIVQFVAAEALGERRFRLSTLLRGRRGTEAAIAGHGAGERFVLLDPAALLAVDLPIEAVGMSLRLRAVGVGDLGSAGQAIVVAGRSLRPLAPVHLRLAFAAGAVTATWVRRSRAGFGWPDFVDVALAEASEAYAVEVRLDGRLVRQATTAVPAYVYGAAERVGDGDGVAVTITVAQLSAVVGPGPAVSATLVI